MCLINDRIQRTEKYRMMKPIQTALIVLVISKSLADLEAKHSGNYHAQDISYETFSRRVKRQDKSVKSQDFYVTQCNHGNMEPTSEPSINVQGRELQYSEATEQAAKLIHLMVRFMPRSIFVNLANRSSVGLFPINLLPTSLFPEFEAMHSACTANCRRDVQTADGVVDCSVWCTGNDYPYNANYPLGYLWAYGNFSRTYVVESNIVCQGFNPGNQGSSQENLLIREFALTVMTRGLGDATLKQLEEAHAAAMQNGTWTGMANLYQYFMMGTQAWFNGIRGSNLGGMACLDIFTPDLSITCEDEYEQRQRLKVLDPKLYNILHFVYNNNRQYVNGDLSVCTW